MQSFTQKYSAKNLKKALLQIQNCLTEMRFFLKERTQRIFFNRKLEEEEEREVELECEMGIV